MKTPTSPAAGRALRAGCAILLLVSVALLPAPPLAAQAAPATDSTKRESDEAVVLSPFTVNTSKDTGFVAATSLAGGRLSTALKDTPVAYSVVTSEFLDAFNVTDLTQAIQWSVNSNSNPSDNSDQGFAFSAAMNVSLRGSKPRESDYPVRNFFPYNAASDSFDIDRFDFARGPNAVLFGAGGYGGTMNAVTKKAELQRTRRELQLSYGSGDRLRATADVNLPLGPRAAVRTALMGERADSWRDGDWTRKSGAYLTGTYAPRRALSIRVESEYVDHKQALAPTSLRDHISAWDGRTTFTATPTGAAVLTAAQQAAAGVNSYSPAGMYIYNPAGFGTSNVINFANVMRTKGATQNANPTLTNFINGRPLLTPNLNFDNQAMLYGYNVPADRFTTALGASSFFRMPSQSTTTLWRGRKPTMNQHLRDVAAYVNYQLGDSFFFELAGDANKVSIDGNNTINRGLAEVYIDINRNLPTGAPNPNFLHPYSDFWTYFNRREHTLVNLRAQAVYARDTRFGKLQLSVLAGTNDQRKEYRALVHLLPLTSLGPDARSWVQAQTNAALWYRMYLDQSDRRFYYNNPGPLTVVDPLTGASTSVTPRLMLDASRPDNSASIKTNYKYIQAAGNFNLFNNRLVVIGALRRDYTDFAVRRTKLPGDYPAGWDGSGFSLKPDAPADWGTLTFVPKDAAGNPTGPAQPAETRPRAAVSGAQLRLTQYANDRFRDDYNPPQIKPTVSTYSIGATVNVTRWLGVFGNAATTFKLNTPLPRLTGDLLVPTSSHGTDYGLRATLPDGRLAASVGAFHSYQRNSAAGLPGNFIGNYNAIYAAPVVGDLTASGRNARNQAPIPTALTDVATEQSHGVEVELTANFTRNWRLIVNGAYTRAFLSDQITDSTAYVQNQNQVARQILADAGVLINSASVASINPAVNDPTRINQAAVNAAVAAWNSLQTAVIPNMVTGRQKLAGGMEQTGNIAMDYAFREGRLKGLMVGGGVNYRGRMALGYRGSDTIVNPANAAQAIDDPTVNAYNTVWSKPYHLASAHAAYTWKRTADQTIRFQLNITNLLNRRVPVYSADPGGAPAIGATVIRSRHGDISSPAVETVPGSHYYLSPFAVTFRITLSM